MRGSLVPSGLLRRAAAFAVLLAAALVARADIADRLDAVAPDPSCSKWWNGAPVKFAALRGRVVLLHFADPTKVTSKAAGASLAKLEETWKAEPVTFVEIAVGAPEDAVAAWAAKHPGRTVGLDARNATSDAYPGSSVPRLYVIGPDGRIAWHAHVGALTAEVVRGQLARVAFCAPPKEAKRAAAAAKAALELEYGKALHEAGRAEADPWCNDADRKVVAAVRDEVVRSHAFQTKLLDTLEEELDWAFAWRRVERMEKMFKGTQFQDAVGRRKAKLEANARVAWVCKAQQLLETVLEDAAKARGRKDIAAVIQRLEGVEANYPETRPAERAAEWRASLERRLAELDAKEGR